MERRFIGPLLLTIVATLGLFAPALFGQAPAESKAGQGGNWTPPKTPWGDPNLQGMWDTRTGVPLERPAEFGNKEFMTEAEAMERRRKGLDAGASGEDEEEGEAEALNKQDEKRYANADKPDDGRPGYRIAGAEYNAFWSADPTRPKMSLRTSRIVDPPDGKLPPLTEAALKRWEARHLARRGRSQADDWRDRNVMERCLMRPGLPMAEMVGTNQFSVVQISQSPGHVTIMMPYGYPRIIRVGKAAHPGKAIRHWNGDAVGRWEGNTLIVETTNFVPKQDGGEVLTVRRPWFYYPGSGDALKMTERFTPTDENTIEYRYTVDDPGTYVRPYTAVVDFVRDTWSASGKQDRIVEYACHEHNYGMTNAIKGAKVDRAQALDEEKREERVRAKELARRWEETKKWLAANGK